MNIYEKRQEQQKLADAYRRKAAEKTGTPFAPTSFVMPSEDGAFVEIVVWVPREELPVEESR